MRCDAIRHVLFLVMLGLSAATAVVAAESSVTFTAQEQQVILSLRAVDSSPTDPTNTAQENASAQALGRLLFFERRMSRSGHLACASCHKPDRDWTDGKAVSLGEGRGSRNAPTLWNVSRRRWYFWDGRADTLWSQALVPIEGAAELGSDRRSIVQLVLSDRRFRSLYQVAFGQPPAAAADAALNTVFANVGKALAAFESTLLRDRAPFDAFAQGLLDGDSQKQDLLSTSAKRGLKTFIGRGNCILCHSGPEFTDEEFHDDRVPAADGKGSLDLGRYNGLTVLKSAEFGAASAYSDDPRGIRAQLTRFQRFREDAREQFRTPSLRNVALTSPYMHAGQFPTLRAVVEFYSRMPLPHDTAVPQETLLGPLNLSEDDVSDLVSFLESLTGQRVRTDWPCEHFLCGREAIFAPVSHWSTRARF